MAPIVIGCFSLHMTFDGLDRPRLRRYVPIALLVTLVGLLQRRAVVDAWVDDRSLVAEPAWFQLAAPLWHATVADTLSIANALTRLLDPLTSASTAGDIRALAAILTAIAAGTLFVLFRRTKVPDVLAFLLCFATVGLMLPVAPRSSATHALHLLLGTALILAALGETPAAFGRRGIPAGGVAPRSNTRGILGRRALPAGRLAALGATPAFHHGLLASASAELNRRLLLLSVLTIAGTLNHASFLAFAAALWAVEWFRAGEGSKWRVAASGTAALTSGMLLVAWLLHATGVASFDIPFARPGVLAMAAGLLTGRFGDGLQPSHNLDLSSAIALCLPGPVILCAPLAALGFAHRDTRRCAVACASGAAALVFFIAGSWLPDPHVAGAPARIAILLLAGLGLSWMALQPGRGAMTLAVLAAALIGVRGLVEPTHWTVPVQTAQLQALVDSAPEMIGRSVWTVDRLTVGRALLAAHPDLAASREPWQPHLLRSVPSNRSLIAFGGIDPRSAGDNVWASPLDIPYPSAARFLAAQPARVWMAVALRGPRRDGFCGDLLQRLGASSQGSAGIAALSRVGEGEPRSSLTGSDRLDVEYGRTLGAGGDLVPARFQIETEPAVRILVNGRAAARAGDGMAIVTFDPWTADRRTWLLPNCGDSARPDVRNSARARAAYLLQGLAQSDGRWAPPAVVDAPVRVRFGADGASWFGAGWHAGEGAGAEAFRWTSARDAEVHVAVARRQALRIRMGGTLAAAGSAPNALGLSWNGAAVQPVGPWLDGSSAEWTVPAELVRRGVNVLTIHVAYLASPAAAGSSSDARALGVAVHALSFEPVTSSPESR